MDVFIIVGLYDLCVVYWEFVKYVVCLCDVVKNGARVLFKIDFSVGYFSASDRY